MEPGYLNNDSHTSRIELGRVAEEEFARQNAATFTYRAECCFP